MIGSSCCFLTHSFSSIIKKRWVSTHHSASTKKNILRAIIKYFLQELCLKNEPLNRFRQPNNTVNCEKPEYPKQITKLQKVLGQVPPLSIMCPYCAVPILWWGIVTKSMIELYQVRSQVVPGVPVFLPPMLPIITIFWIFSPGVNPNQFWFCFCLHLKNTIYMWHV